MIAVIGGLAWLPSKLPQEKNEYVRRQRVLAERAEPIRHRLINIVDDVQRARLDGYGASLHT